MPDENDKLENIKQVFYDIESLDNVFSLCSHRYNENSIHPVMETANSYSLTKSKTF